MSKEIALEMVKLGFHVFPLSPYGKPPNVRKLNWNGMSGFHLGSNDPERVADMFDTVLSHYKTRCYGVRGGMGGLIIVDTDSKDGERDGLAVFRAKCESEGWWDTIQDTFQVSTPTGGVHFYIRIPPEKAAKHKSTTEIDGLKGVDTRGIDGYVVGPGSQRIDRELPYTPISEPILREAPPGMVRWLAGATSLAKVGSNDGSGQGGRTAGIWSYQDAINHWRPFIIGPGTPESPKKPNCIPDGGRNTVLFDFAWGLAADAWDEGVYDDEAITYVERTLTLVYDACDPPYEDEAPEHMAERAVGSLQRYKNQQLAQIPAWAELQEVKKGNGNG